MSQPRTPEQWRGTLDALPSAPDNIPAFFFAHGSPMLVYPESQQRDSLLPFLRDFGPALLKKYQPKGIVVFSAHWETLGERLVTDYGEENPLLMDYYGFPPALYELKFKSRGDSALAHRVTELYKEAGQRARTTSNAETRGVDGRGFPGPGLDHGVFIPFRIMFGEEFLDIPIVQVSIDSSLSPETNWALGKALSKLRKEGVLILSGGLTVHNLQNMASFFEDTAGPLPKQFDQALLDAVSVTDPPARKLALISLTQHPGFRACHPREDHFIPVYVAAGAGEGGDVKIIAGLYGAPTFAFGL